MKLPQLTKGRRVTAILQEMVNYMRASTVTNVIGGKLRQSTSGITIEIDRPKPGKGGGASLPTPGLQIIDGSEAGKYRITPGFINAEMPTLATVALDDEEPPEFEVTATTHVWAKCVGTFGTPDSYVTSIVTQTSFDEPAGTAITATGFVSFYKIGRVDFTAGTGGDPDTYQIFNNHSGGNLGVDSWGLYNLWWRA